MLRQALKSLIRTREIEFMCYAEDLGVIAEPFPARKLMPDWYRALTPKIGSGQQLLNSTVKRCAPVLDAMTAGWIIPLAADVEFVTNEDATGVTYKWQFYRNMVENHFPEQVAGHPELPKPPMKFLNWWMIRVPKGYSLLFVPPLNRPDPRFTCFSGMVDADKYLEFINFPFWFNKPNFTGVLKQGTPLVQVIPIRREAFSHSRRGMKKADMEKLAHLRRRRSAHESLYRDNLWVRK